MPAHWRHLPVVHILRSHHSSPLTTAVLVLTAIVSLTSACGVGSATPTARTASAAPAAGLPPFPDWHAVYVDYVGRLHAVSLDGHQDIRGPQLSLTGHGPWSTPSVSPDGHWLAYDCSPVCIRDLTGRYGELNYPLATAGLWSQDSGTLAVSHGAIDVNHLAGVATIHMPDGTSREIPPPPGATFAPIGWVDTSHLAGIYSPTAPTPTPRPTSTPPGDYSPPPGKQTATLAVQDITTGAVRIAFSLTSSSMGLGYFSLAPDGRHALFYNTPQRDYPYTPDVRLIDVTTGATTRLPHLAQALGQDGGIRSIAWRAGTQTLAASTGDLKTWLLDALHDTAQMLPYQGVVGGWAPESDTLVLSTAQQPAQWQQGPFTLTAVANITSGSGTATTLTTDAYTFVAGFARTAA